MKSLKGYLAIFGVVIVALFLFFGAKNFLDFDLKFGGNEVEQTITPASPAEIIKIEAINLDCRARITASVPVEGKREHKMFGKVYRTDKMSLVAIGDVDTCVNGGATIDEVDGFWNVTVQASSIEFVRPRVDAVKTMDSVETSKGWVGKITDAFPGVADTNGLTPAGYAYAQAVIGGSGCMNAAWNTTVAAINEAYTEQAIEKGIGSETVRVTVVGQPDFGQSDDELSNPDFEKFKLEVKSGDAECLVRPDAYASPSAVTS